MKLASVWKGLNYFGSLGPSDGSIAASYVAYAKVLVYFGNLRISVLIVFRSSHIT